ncbi:hypothetical protein HYPSUDRAFT_65847 [Hypholoma sublateritium FD-334 SS-4]|uniref:Uncharacterized protein n=1 Tax=Hypholoma sublateritium (strain FD-334 SS-4) TaxID=945553 RepID=A0A0D2P5P2_HYPSF|nr:hypothetical protein HYPSUDRAFT_65847 [Hypholoma sublateritium FD-334 SS-4]
MGSRVIVEERRTLSATFGSSILPFTRSNYDPAPRILRRPLVMKEARIVMQCSPYQSSLPLEIMMCYARCDSPLALALVTAAIGVIDSA